MQRITLDSEISYVITEEELKEIRTDERRKLLNWLDDEDALGTEVYDSKHFCYYHQRLSPEEVLKDYEESMKGDN